MGGENDFAGDWYTSYYHGDHPLIPVNYKAGNSPQIEIEFGDVENWKTDSEIGNYSVNYIVSNEYRDAGRSGDTDVSVTLENTDFIRWNWRGGKARTINSFG